MKVLFAVQATGNGHLCRAREIIPYLQEKSELDILVSGIQGDIILPYHVKYEKYGLSIIFGKNGGIDMLKTFQKTRPLQFIKDYRSCPVKDYDLVINDFEPITAWACKKIGMPCLALSHQSALLSDKTPRPRFKNPFIEYGMKIYAPTTSKIAFHFDQYDTFINTPIIRREIRQATISEQNHIAVYLPAVGDKTLIKHFTKIPSIKWKVFSKHCYKKYQEKNVEVNPINNKEWIMALASSSGVVMGAGFEGPSEALFLGKKLLVIPMFNQYEQLCNAAALKKMGVTVSRKIKYYFSDILKDWIKNITPLQINYKDQTKQIVNGIFA